MKNNQLYLSNIQECIQNIETYTKDGEDGFRVRILTLSD